MKSLAVAITAFALSLGSGSGFALESTPAQERSGTAGETVSFEAEEATQEVSEQIHHQDRALSVMDEPLDGSSMETFTAGLEKLDKEATEKEYRTVMSALDFLLFYDIGAKRDRARLYSRLNGKSPNQILEQVARTRQGPAVKH